MRRNGFFIGVVFVVVGVAGIVGKVWHAPKPPTEPVKPGPPLVTTTTPTVTPNPPPATMTELPSPLPFEFIAELPPSDFSGQVDLWGEPWVKAPESPLSYASLSPEEAFKLATAERFQSRLDGRSEPVLTVHDRQVVYSLFGSGGFSLKVNLKPAYPSPEAWIPTRVDPGISGSFSF
jgi:hypothetical protein